MSAKKGPWSEADDAFLLEFHGVGANFVASHDLGRADGAGEARLKKLIDTGAAHEFACAMAHMNRFRELAGHARASFATEVCRDAQTRWSGHASQWPFVSPDIPVEAQR